MCSISGSLFFRQLFGWLPVQSDKHNLKLHQNTFIVIESANKANSELKWHLTSDTDGRLAFLPQGTKAYPWPSTTTMALSAVRLRISATAW